jgi:predicted nuclease of predicted toxin-antitoxin system
MKFLFDQSADFRLIPHLQANGHDVTAISRQYPHGLPDEDVLAIAKKENRILLVTDRDFGELIFNQGHLHAGVIFFRLPGTSLQDKIQQLDRVLTEYAKALEGGKFVVVTVNRIRVASLPSLK